MTFCFGVLNRTFWEAKEKVAQVRAADSDYILNQLLEAGISGDKISAYSSIENAYNAALAGAAQADCLVVFGSFYTVASVLPLARQIGV